jgi:hypothetical protein
MKHQHISAIRIVITSILLVVSMTLAAQDPFTLKAPNGVAFSEFKGYEAWEVIAPSKTDDALKVIVGNATMVKAFKEGIPGNGQPVPDGAAMANIEWAQQDNSASPYSVTVPGALKSVSFMVKDAKRFPDTDGWGYVRFVYDGATGSFNASGRDSSFGKTVCHQCHTRAKARDFVFTGYARR